MFCLDVDSEKFWVGLNGSWFASGNPSTGVNPSASGFGKSNWTTVQSDYTYSGAGSFQHNYGQDPTFGGNKTSGSADAPDAKGIGAFYYQPPTGALALCTANLTDFTPTVTGDTPQDYFKAVTWTNATTDIDVTVNLPFQADMIWWKQRDQANSHRLIDSVRGLTSELTPNSDIGEAIIDPTTRKYNVTVINADNFKFNGYVNTATRGGPMVGWCWKAGGSPSGSTSTTGSAKRINTSGTQDDTSCSALATAATNAGASNVITPTLMSINQAAGFSIATYSISSTTSANDFTIPHGLNKAPEFIIVKSTTGTQQWCVYHHSESSKAGFLQRYIGFTTSEHTNNFNGTVPTSQVFTVGHPTNNNSGDTCRDGHSYVAYCFHGVEGYSKFGSYTGNGSTDGPFLYCGFRPAFVMYKNIGAISSAFASWGMIDSSRSSYNPTGGGNTLWANMSTQEGYRGNGTNLIGANDYLNFDFVSNGFKLRGSGNNTETNDNAQVYIFMAFAEQPFKFSNAR
jgi:hypothetical protein